MKKLFFSLALALVGLTASANTQMVDGSIEVTLSCGIEGTLSWTGDVTTQDIVDAVSYFDDLLC
jgi:hypothetical protein